MALINIVEESDVEIIPSSCSFTSIGKPNEELKLLKDHSSNLNGFVHSSRKKRIVAAHSYVNPSQRSRKRMKKKSFNFVNEFSQNHSQSLETIFWSQPTLANKTNCTPTKDNKKDKNNSSCDTHLEHTMSFEGESLPTANNSDSCIYVNNNKKHSPDADINNSSSRFLSLSPLKKKCIDRMFHSEASAANLDNEVYKSPSEVLFKKSKPNSVISSSKEDSGEFQSLEISSQNAVLEIENKNSCNLNNVNAESAPPFSCDLFDSNLVTAPITEELHTVKVKLSLFKEKKENKRKEIMVNNVESLSSHLNNSKDGQTLQMLTDEINGLINQPNSETIIECESDSKKLEDERSNDAHFSPEKCREYDNPTKKLLDKKKLKDVASSEVHSSPEKVNGFDNSPKKLRNKKLDDVSAPSPQKVNEWDNSPKKHLNKKVRDDHFSPEKSSGDRFSPEKCREYDNPTKKQLDKKKLKDVASSEVHSSPEKVNGLDNSPKKLRNKKLDDLSAVSPQKVNEWDNSPKKHLNKKVRDDHFSPEKSSGDRFSPEKCREYDNPTKKQLDKKKLKDVASSEVHSSPEKVNGLDNSPKKLRNKKLDDLSAVSPQKVNEWDNSPKKLLNKRVRDDHFSPEKCSECDDISTRENVNGYDSSPKKLQNKKERDELSSVDHSSVEKVNRCDRSPNKTLDKKHNNGTSREGLSNPETVTEDDKSMKKQRKKKLGVVITSDDHPNPKIIYSYPEKRDENYNGIKKQCNVNMKDEGSKAGNSSLEIGSEVESPVKNLRNSEMMVISSTDYDCRPEIVSESEYRTKKQRHSKLVHKTLTYNHSSPDKVPETDHALRVQRNTRSKNKRSIDQYSRPEIVSESEYRTEKQRNSKQIGTTSTDCHSSPGNKINENDSALREQWNTMSNKRSIDQYSSPEIVSESDYRTKKQRISEQVGSTSSDNRSSLENNVNKRKRDGALRKQSKTLSNKRSLDQYSSPEIVSESEYRTKKQRNSEQVDSTSSGSRYSLENKVNETDGALRKQSNTLSNKRSIDQYSSPEIVSKFEGRTKKQRNSEQVRTTFTDRHSSPDNKTNENDSAKKQRRRIGKPLERTSNDDQTATNGVKDIIFCNSEIGINDFRLILLKDEIPLTDKEICCLHRKLAKAYTLSEELCNKLRNLDINITWKLSEFHRDYTFIHNGEFSYADKSDLRHSKLKEGAFEPEENEAIMNRWKTFCKLYNFNALKDFRGFLPRSYDLKKSNPLSKYEKLKFVQFLGQDLPDRLLHMVYARFIEMFKNYCKGRFVTEEDDLLLIFKKYSRNRRIYSILSSLLHRSRYSIYRRMKILVNFYGDLESLTLGDTSSKNSNENNIDPQEENELSASPCSSSRYYVNETLRKTIANLTGSEDIQKWDSFTANISCWRRIGKKCKIPPVEAKLQYLCNLRIKSLPHKITQTSYLQMRIIHSVKKYQWKKWKSINWNLLSEELSHLGPVFLYVTFRRYIKNSVPSEFWGKLTDCLNYIEQNDNQNNNINLQNEDISEDY